MIFLLIWISFLIISVGWTIDMRLKDLIKAIEEGAKKKTKEECFKCTQDILGV